MTLIVSIVAVAAISSFSQGYIGLDNHDSNDHPLVTYGANSPVNGVNGTFYGTPGEGLNSS